MAFEADFGGLGNFSGVGPGTGGAGFSFGGNQIGGGNVLGGGEGGHGGGYGNAPGFNASGQINYMAGPDEIRAMDRYLSLMQKTAANTPGFNMPQGEGTFGNIADQVEAGTANFSAGSLGDPTSITKNQIPADLLAKIETELETQSKGLKLSTKEKVLSVVAGIIAGVISMNPLTAIGVQQGAVKAMKWKNERELKQAITERLVADAGYTLEEAEKIASPQAAKAYSNAEGIATNDISAEQASANYFTKSGATPEQVQQITTQATNSSFSTLTNEQINNMSMEELQEYSIRQQVMRDEQTWQASLRASGMMVDASGNIIPDPDSDITKHQDMRNQLITERLSGEPSKALAQSLTEGKKISEEELSRRLGSGFARSTPGIQTSNAFNRTAEILKETERLNALGLSSQTPSLQTNAITQGSAGFQTTLGQFPGVLAPGQASNLQSQNFANQLQLQNMQNQASEQQSKYGLYGTLGTLALLSGGGGFNLFG